MQQILSELPENIPKRFWFISFFTLYVFVLRSLCLEYNVFRNDHQQSDHGLCHQQVHQRCAVGSDQCPLALLHRPSCGWGDQYSLFLVFSCVCVLSSLVPQRSGTGLRLAPLWKSAAKGRSLKLGCCGLEVSLLFPLVVWFLSNPVIH